MTNNATEQNHQDPFLGPWMAHKADMLCIGCAFGFGFAAGTALFTLVMRIIT